MNRTYSLFVIGLVALGALVSACSRQGAVPASYPEKDITLAETNIQRILNALNQHMIAKEYQVTFNGPEKAVYRKPTGSFTENPLYNTSPYRQTESLLEVTFLLAPTDRGTRISVASRRIENPGSVNERSSDENQWAVLQQMRGVLRDLKQTIE